MVTQPPLEEKPCPPSGRGFFCRCEVPRVERLALAKSEAVVIDEAHHCLDVGGVQDREDSLRRRLAEVLARRCDCLLLDNTRPLVFHVPAG